MSRLRIIVGPECVLVERDGVQSETRSIGMEHGPAEVRAIGQELWVSIRPFVSWRVWVLHRLRMAVQRGMAGAILSRNPGPYYPGPQPYHVALRPWREAAWGDWAILPRGVVARLLREGKAP